MRVVVVASVVIAACSAQHAAQQDAPPVMPDARPVYMGQEPAPLDDCVHDGLATLDIDGTWHMVGTSTSWTDYGSGSSSESGVIDEYVTIQRYGCFAGMAMGSAVPAMDSTLSTATALEHDCYYTGPECSRGLNAWSICLRSDGTLRYRRDEQQQHLTMYWGGMDLATLTR